MCGVWHVLFRSSGCGALRPPPAITLLSHTHLVYTSHCPVPHCMHRSALDSDKAREQQHTSATRVDRVYQMISEASDTTEEMLLRLGERMNLVPVAGAVFVPFLVYIAVL